MERKTWRPARIGVLLFTLALALVLGAEPLSALVQRAVMPTVRVWPVDQEVLVGHQSSVELRIENVVDLFAVELHVTYDPAIIQVLDAEAGLPGVQIEAGDIFAGLPWHVDLNQVDAFAGTIEYVFALDSVAQGGVVGSGVLARINFLALQPGVSPIRYVEVVLARRGGESIEHLSMDGTVRVVTIPSTATPTVEGWVSPTPTETSLPLVTVTPGSTIPAGPTLTPTFTLIPSVSPTATHTPVPPSPTPRPTPIVYFDPSPQDVSPGTTSWVDIKIDHADGLYGAWILVHFNSQVIQVLDSDPAKAGVQVEPGDIFAGKSWYVFANAVEPITGTLTYGAKLSFDEPAGVTGGTLARIHYYTQAMGACPLEIADVILVDRNGVSFAASTEDGLINVGQEFPTPPTATPTESPAATATPTPTSTPEPTPIIYVVPEASSLNVGDEMDLSIWVANVVNLYGVEFHLGYNPTVLQVLDADPAIPGTQIDFGAFLSPDSVAQNEVDETAGIVHFAISQNSPSPARSGTGVVAHLRVRALAEGTSMLGFSGTELTNVFAQSVPHWTKGGYVTVNTRVVLGYLYLQGRQNHGGLEIKRGNDVLAVTADDGFFAFACPVGAGEVLDLWVDHEGYLPLSKSFVVPADAVIDLGAATLLGGDAVGPQIVAQRAAGCPGDPTVTMPGPADQNINILDLTFVGGHFGSMAGDQDWEPSPDGCHPEWISGRADINGDQVCNIFDLVQVGNNFGASGPQPW